MGIVRVARFPSPGYNFLRTINLNEQIWDANGVLLCQQCTIIFTTEQPKYQNTYGGDLPLLLVTKSNQIV